MRTCGQGNVFVFNDTTVVADDEEAAGALMPGSPATSIPAICPTPRSTYCIAFNGQQYEVDCCVPYASSDRIDVLTSITTGAANENSESKFIIKMAVFRTNADDQIFLKAPLPGLDNTQLYAIVMQDAPINPRFVDSHAKVLRFDQVDNDITHGKLAPQTNETVSLP
ncbi:hypothetical protein C8R44DRAFT_724985 [Mycena epipterygia]|nr:hypothetical protein C8R44DRAFT_724985 [Mycena epipterygia]